MSLQEKAVLLSQVKEMEEHGMRSFLIYEFNLPEELGGD
jgi:ERCC4-type nuclease